MKTLLQGIDRVLISQEALQTRVAELAEQISADYKGLNPLLVCVLKGGYIFLADLSRALSINHAVDFMAISSYGNGSVSSGVVRILKDLDRDISGRNVLLVEDIIDTGNTIAYIMENLRTRQPASVRVCTLLSKPSRREVFLQADYVGFEIPNDFVIGYGLDYAEAYRNLPYIGVLKPEVYS
ncbi:MAG: hypoxanthine phosphoribosyltransferase [Chloroflexi bacterium]|nr:hypoxanthine phosphoribosyltransferase [Chloroflexota bacterium]